MLSYFTKVLDLTLSPFAFITAKRHHHSQPSRLHYFYRSDVHASPWPTKQSLASELLLLALT
jgi:hypothetical protein